MIHDYVQDSKPRFLEPFELEQHLQSFCIELSEAGYRQLTINGYFDSVCHFGSWLNHRGILLKCIDARTLDQFSKLMQILPALGSNPNMYHGKRSTTPRPIL